MNNVSTALKPRIVRAEPAHVHGIVEVWKGFIDIHAMHDPFFTRRADGHLNFERYIREQIAAPGSLVLVALDGRDVVGYSLSLPARHPPVYLREAYGLISDMAVKEGHRRRGIGEAMYREISDFFRRSGIDRIELRMSPRNPLASAFWEKMGFKEHVRVLCREI